VQKGDLLNNIAKKYNVTTKDILAINQISNADSLTVGQVLRIPKV
jgi:LysM repeat protein